MAPLRSLRIQNVRHLEDLTLTGLGEINLLFGTNDSGKSSILEAIALWCDPLNPHNWKQVAKYRSTWPFYELGSTLSDLESLFWLFRRAPQQQHLPITLSGEGTAPFLSLSAQIEAFDAISGQWDEEPDVISIGRPRIRRERQPQREEQPQILLDIAVQGDLSASDYELFPNANRHSIQRTLRFWEQTSGRTPTKQRTIESYRPLECKVVNNLSHRSENLLKSQFSDVIRSDYKDSVLEALRILDPNIEELAILTPQEDLSEMAHLRALRGDASLQIRYKETGFLPLSSFGDGLRRILHIAFQLPKLRGGVLLIDEIEVSIHASKSGMFFDWLAKNCQTFQIQLFATTHSLEAIDAILGEKGERADSITAFRLQQGTAKRFSGEQLKRLRLDRGLEVRGT